MATNENPHRPYGAANYAVIDDNPAQRRAESALQASEARLAAIITSAMDAIITVDVDQRIVLFNAAAEKMFRCRAADVIGQTLDRFIPQRFQTIHQKHIQRFGATGTTSRTMGALRALSAVRADGEEFPIEASISQSVVDDQRLYTVIVRDITERVRAEATLVTLAAVVESANDAIITQTLEGEITIWNPAAERMYGYTAPEVIGRSSLILYPSDRSTELAMIMDRVRRGERLQQFETVRVAKDGRRLDVSLSVAPLIADTGHVTGAATTARDITERKREEERRIFLARAGETLAGSLDYETTLAAVARLAVPIIADWCAVYLVGSAGTLNLRALAHVNPDKVQWARELQRRYPTDLNAPSGVPHVVRSGQAEFVPEIPAEALAALRQDPEIARILDELQLTGVMTVPLITHGRTLGAISLVSAESRQRYTAADLALAEELARRASVAVENAQLYRQAQALNAELEQRVAERTAQLEASNKELESFSYSVSHDLRAPLRHIVGYLELLQKSTTSTLHEKDRRYFDIIAEAAGRMGHLIDDLLAFSRVGRSDLTKTQFAMQSLVQEVVGEFAPDLKDRSVTWDIGLLPHVNADRAMLRLVWMNLISNALKYTRPRAEAEITIGCERVDGEHVYYIRDNGVGFDMKYRAKLFGVFQRLHSATEFEGTGIGLANVWRIISRHAGRTWAEGAIDGGATFYFSLPAELES